MHVYYLYSFKFFYMVPASKLGLGENGEKLGGGGRGEKAKRRGMGRGG